MDLSNADFDAGEVLFVNKPLEWTSFDVVKKIKYALKIKKIGHAGTLDPLATGLLILCTGKFTKKIEAYQAQEKEYTGVLVLGKTTPSVDLETQFDSETDTAHIKESAITETCKAFIGEIDQIPPQHSAIKVNGERVYKKARKGVEVVLKPRKVTIKTFEITNIAMPEVHFKVVCSKGTYIRSLVRDVGTKLGVGAYLKSLIRTRIGPHKLSESQSLKELIEKAKAIKVNDN